MSHMNFEFRKHCFINYLIWMMVRFVRSAQEFRDLTSYTFNEPDQTEIKHPTWCQFNREYFQINLRVIRSKNMLIRFCILCLLCLISTVRDREQLSPQLDHFPQKKRKKKKEYRFASLVVAHTSPVKVEQIHVKHIQ